MIVASACSGPAAAQRTEPRPHGTLTKQTYVSPVDGAAIDYALWLPPSYEQGGSWPLIVDLHGSGQGTDWQAPTTPKGAVPVLGELSDLPFVVVFPLLRGSSSISAQAERDVIDTIADVTSRFKVDPDRVHLVGLSFGGFAAWSIACRYPHVFASLTTFSAGGEPDLAVNLRHVPTQVYHGGKDGRVKAALSREMVAAMGEADIPVRYVEEPDGYHTVWRAVLGDRAFYEWLADQTRVRTPRRISYRTHSLRHASAYWLTIESMLDPAEPAYADVFVPPGTAEVMIHGENLARLILDPPHDVLGPEVRPRFMVNDGPVEVERTDRGWVLHLSGDSPAEPEKRPGLSGPIQDVFHDPFVVAVASRGEPRDVARWQAAAASAMSWTQGMVTANVRVVPADQVTREMMAAAHLICFGTPANHPVLAELVGRLPLHAADGRLLLEGDPLSPWAVSFVMIYPNPLAPARYIVVCSGRPEATGRLAAVALTPPTLNPPPIEDLLVMQGDGRLVPWGGGAEPADNREVPMGARVPARGPVFDRHWQLTPEARDWLRDIPRPPPASQPARAKVPG